MTTPELLRPVDPEAPLLVVATRQEAEHLSADLPILLTGIGRINTVAALTEVLADVKPASVINIGTAGSLGSASGVHRVGSVLLHDFSHSAVADLTGGVAYPPITLADDGPVLATGDLFVEDSVTRVRLAEIADLVDMEGYAVAWVARRHGVPVELIKLVSDPAGEDAGRLWIDGVAECSRILDAHLAERFSGLAAGVSAGGRRR